MAHPEKILLEGPNGTIEIAVDEPRGSPLGIALVAHPHPLMGGSQDNKVAVTLARAFTDVGVVAWRPNFRGVGASSGEFDAGKGETEDLAFLLEALQERYPGVPFFLAGFSFGAFVQARLVQKLMSEGRPLPSRLILVGTAVARFDVPTVPAETLLIHGERDDVIPLSDLFEWARTQSLPVLVIPGADHFFHRCLHFIREAVRSAVLRTRDFNAVG
jgi:alpha/beta superfamily hydrolase